MTTRTIIVTAADIDAGTRCAMRSCPVALAMRRAGLEDPTANRYRLLWREGGRYIGCDTPRSVVAFMNAFCRRRKARPFAFELPAGDFDRWRR